MHKKRQVLRSAIPVSPGFHWIALPLLISAACWTLAVGTEVRPQRLRPPENIPCDRNQLTSFTGEVLSYERRADRISIRMRTDEDTREQFTIRYREGDGPVKWLRIRGDEFKSADWRRIESSEGRLRAGMRLTVWVCETAANPIFDWRPPPDDPP